MKYDKIKETLDYLDKNGISFKKKPVRVRYSFKRNYNKSGECIRCPNCGCKEFSDLITETISGNISQRYTFCTWCEHEVNFWAYGSYDPMYRNQDRSIPALFVRIMNKFQFFTWY